jgi:hypothetical protein
MSDLFVPVPPQRPAVRDFYPHGRRGDSPARLRVHSRGRLCHFLIGCALIPILATGCAMNDGMSRVVEVDLGQFNRVVLQSQQPVLVNFYKPG